MTRRALSILVGVTGTLVAGLTILLLLVMGSVFADARTENIAGPGVDVFLRTPFPAEGGTIVVDVEARGGSRAGIRTVDIVAFDRTLKMISGKGVTWGHRVQNGRQRGSDTETLRFPIPPELHAGDTLPLKIAVKYVVAMSENGSFSNDDKSAVVSLDVDIYSSGGRIRAQLARVLLGLGSFLIWFLLVWGVAKLYANAKGDAVGRHNAEMEGIGLLMGFMGGSVLGYWLFAWRIMNALELSSTLWSILLMGVWCVAPLVFVWKWWKRRNRGGLPAARVVVR